MLQHYNLVKDVMDLKINPHLFITKAKFYEVFSAKHKPVFVKGRDFYSLSYRHSGKISITCNGEELISCADCVTFVPKGLSYTTEVLEDVYMTTIQFDFESETLPDKPVVIPVRDPMIRSMFEALTKKSAGTSDKLMRMSLFYKLLYELSRLTPADVGKAVPEKITKAKRIIDESFADPYFSIDSLSDKLGVSPTYLRREFRTAFQISPIRYLKELRIKTAKRTLLSSDHTVSKVAELCGYTSTSYFIQDFHKTVGESPDRYRNRLRISP